MDCACYKAILVSVTSMTVSGVSQGGPRLMAVKADWRQEHHAYLAFSFPTEGTTSVLDIQGTHFQPIHLPGLDPNSPSLLLEALPGGWLVQVTPEVVAICTICTKHLMCHVAAGSLEGLLAFAYVLTNHLLSHSFPGAVVMLHLKKIASCRRLI